MLISLYQRFGKRIINILFSIIIIISLWPLALVIAFVIGLDSKGKVIFKQKRVGKKGKPFTLYKFRTMVSNAEELKKKYLPFNEAKGPVFKIKDDPRYTNVGKILSKIGLDELPQAINILKGEMSLVGPRPLPVNEEAQIPKKWQTPRRQSKPGIACSWFINGAHQLSFNKWMELDIKDINSSSFTYDLELLLKTIISIIRYIKYVLT